MPTAPSASPRPPTARRRRSWPGRTDLRLTKYANESDEIDGIVRLINQLVREGTGPGEIAILYRINARSTVFEHSLHREQVPFQVADGGFLERPAWRSVRQKLAASKSAADVTRVVAAILDDAGYVPDIKEAEVSPQEFTRQLDLAFIDNLARKFGKGGTVADFVIGVEREFASYSKGDTREAGRLTTYHLAKIGRAHV